MWDTLQWSSCLSYALSAPYSSAFGRATSIWFDANSGQNTRRHCVELKTHSFSLHSLAFSFVSTYSAAALLRSRAFIRHTFFLHLIAIFQLNSTFFFANRHFGTSNSWNLTSVRAWKNSAWLPRISVSSSALSHIPQWGCTEPTVSFGFIWQPGVVDFFAFPGFECLFFWCSVTSFLSNRYFLACALGFVQVFREKSVQKWKSMHFCSFCRRKYCKTCDNRAKHTRNTMHLHSLIKLLEFLTKWALCVTVLHRTSDSKFSYVWANRCCTQPVLQGITEHETDEKVYDHTALKARHPVWSGKLSSAGPG